MILAIGLTVNRFSRIAGMCMGALITGTIFFTPAAIQCTHPPHPEGSPSASKAMMALIYLHVIVFSFTMGPLA
ncbi:hypothetical protein BDQ12DRAFT_723995 [Crucibulum laeve]|uniref:Uncharacterized protein n=1 Tax=Crucibulum laeve TaxID=68775 RepID=A0A5C3LXH5_9AGAR|nr:hypothetical protein BDQ12DRAFT_723995 [Crucibulum laeve]